MIVKPSEKRENPTHDFVGDWTLGFERRSEKNSSRSFANKVCKTCSDDNQSIMQGDLFTYRFLLALNANALILRFAMLIWDDFFEISNSFYSEFLNKWEKYAELIWLNFLVDLLSEILNWFEFVQVGSYIQTLFTSFQLRVIQGRGSGSKISFNLMKPKKVRNFQTLSKTSFYLDLKFRNSRA